MKILVRGKHHFTIVTTLNEMMWSLSAKVGSTGKCEYSVVFRGNKGSAEADVIGVYVLVGAPLSA